MKSGDGVALILSKIYIQFKFKGKIINQGTNAANDQLKTPYIRYMLACYTFNTKQTSRNPVKRENMYNSSLLFRNTKHSAEKKHIALYSEEKRFN